jgi:hypothetical protein
MNNWKFPFLLYAARIVPDKNMEFTEKTKDVTANILVVLCQNLLSYMDSHV